MRSPGPFRCTSRTAAVTDDGSREARLASRRARWRTIVSSTRNGPPESPGHVPPVTALFDVRRFQPSVFALTRLTSSVVAW